MKPFTPKRADGRSRAKVVVDLVLTRDYGDLIGFSELEKELDTSDHHVVYGAVGRANRVLWKEHQRTLEAEPGTGYRILKPDEFVKQAGKMQKRAKRGYKASALVVQAVPLDLIESETDRQLVLATMAMTNSLINVIRQHERKLRHHDTLFSELDDRLSRVEEQLKRKE